MKCFNMLFLNENCTQKTRMFVLVFSQILLISISPLNAWSEQDHDHAHEVSEQHAPHHEAGDHDEHENHVDHDNDGHDHDAHGVEDELEHDTHSSEDEHGHGEENSSHIEDAMAKQVGIVTSMVGAQELHQTITVYGSIVSAPEQLSHVRARFEGLVKSVKATLGDRVNAGDVLAEIESNESLKTYTIRSPITGRVVQRHANTGEVTQNQILFSIANFDIVWAELRVYPAQQSSLTEGQVVHVLAGNDSVSSTVDHIVPSMESPYLVARVKLANSKHTLSPGLMIEARVETGRFSVPLAISKNAVQTLGGRQGVFVKDGDEYSFTPLVLGQSDDHFYEVVEGLTVGSEYVSENSYLIKADIEKSEAEHEH